MKTAIKLVLIYFGFQIISAILVLVPATIYSLIKYGEAPASTAGIVAPSLLLSIVLMGLYLWKEDYISSDKRTWSPVSAAYLILSVISLLAFSFMIDFAISFMPWLPNLMENTFDTLQAGWLGILVISVFGPILEEVLFRGAITTVLLKKYSPAKAIILSALIFGIFHINPVQIFVATLIGLFLGWVFYKTASLVPCILIHMVNNALSVHLELKFPDATYLRDIFTPSVYYTLLIGFAVVLILSILWLKRTTVAFPWKESEPKEVEHTNNED